MSAIVAEHKILHDSYADEFGVQAMDHERKLTLFEPSIF
jgi:hypothetical protein